jgi:putative copper resistance protein D
MLGAALWVGGLVWLLLGIRELHGAERPAAVHCFSQLAFAAATLIVIIMRVLHAVPEVGSPGVLASTSFGIALLVKTGLFAVLMGLAWRNRYRLAPSIVRSEPTAADCLTYFTGGGPEESAQGAADPLLRKETG